MREATTNLYNSVVAGGSCCPNANPLVVRGSSTRRARVYRAFVDPDELLAWLPPAEMTGQMHAFDARVDGGYQMSLFYAPDEQTFQGKTAELEDRVVVRFVALSPPERIVEAVTFVSAAPAFAGKITLTTTLAEVVDGTEVTMLFENLPPGLRPEGNQVGADLSLRQFAGYLSES